MEEILKKKIEQIDELAAALDDILKTSFAAFAKDIVKIRAAERNFQLLVDTASDINTQILLVLGKKTPDTYRQSFEYLAQAGVISAKLGKKLSQSAGLRNILVHEYDFDADYETFYRSAKQFIPVYREYAAAVFGYLKRL